MSEPVPPWKFWHPLPLWHAVVIAFVAQIVCTIPFVALREVAHVNAPAWIGNGLGGVVMYLAVRFFANKRLAAGAADVSKT